MRLLTLVGVFLRVGVMNELHYRVNFLVQLFQSAISLVTALAVLGLVFGHTQELNGWSQAELLAVMGVHIAMGGVIGTFIQPNMNRLVEGIRNGTFDFLLTKPEDAQLLASVQEIRIWRAVDIVVGAVVLGVALSLLGGGVGPPAALAFGIALVLGALMIYCFWLLMTIAAFWIVRIDEIAELFEGIYQAGRWPVSIYPGWLRIGLTFLVPLAFAITVPAEALTGRLTVETLALAAGFALFLLVLARLLWRVGLKRYSGASA
ncbi:MAG TPA: ABC-2 family transporter protein [Candidatus Limnocylindria bacterium]|nr:ABC-2 family transporter protein [Candidatus Limnocylindria bacterium]